MNKIYLSKQLNIARKSQDKVAIEAFKAVISEIDLRSATVNISENDIENILKKEAKKFTEASVSFKEKDSEKSSHYAACSALLKAYLPKLIDCSKYPEIIQELKKNNNDFGSLMKAAKSTYGSSLDMKEFSKIAKQLF